MSEANNDTGTSDSSPATAKVLMRKKSTTSIPVATTATNKRYSLGSPSSPASATTTRSSKLPVFKRHSTISSSEEPSPSLPEVIKEEEVVKMKPVGRTVSTPVRQRSATVATAAAASTTPVSKFQQFKQEMKLKQTNKQHGGVDDIVIATPSTLTTNPKVLQTLLKQARMSGSLNLSSYGLTQIPLKVLRINVDKMDDKEENDDENGFRWWQQVDLQKLYLASNKIKEIPKDVEFLETLVVFDAHDNEIETINQAIGVLSQLQTLNMSHNSIKSLPDSVCQLRNLLSVNLAHNQLAQLPKEFGYLDYLEDLNLSHNELTDIPKSFGYFTKLRTLNLASNKLTRLLPEVFFSHNLRIIDLSENQLESIPDVIGNLINLEQLYICKNRLKEFPNLKGCCQLKDLDCSYNFIKEIKVNNLKNLVAIIMLNLRENQLTVLPNDICDLTKLERLDLTNNGLLSLPPEIALLENMKQLLLTGNPLRSIRKDVLSRGTDAILKSLKNHIELPAEKTSPGGVASGGRDSLSGDIKYDVIKASRSFDYSCKKATEFPTSSLSLLHQASVHTVNLSKNVIKTLPGEFVTLDENLTSLIYSFNQLTSVPEIVFKLKSLLILDLRGNQLSELDPALAKLVSLREIIIADNRFTEIPDAIFDLKNLENLFANGNQISIINVDRMSNLKHLSTLNLQNNNISTVPPMLGRLENIKSLVLDGNPLRVLRPQILAKGTAAILEYLRGRIVEN